MRFREEWIFFAALALAATVNLDFAIAQETNSIGITEPSIATSLPHNAAPYGTRKWLYDHGVAYNFIYTNDVLSNLSGGIKRGTIDQGKLEAQLLIDLDKLAGWKDWSFYANAFGIYNNGRIRRDYVGGMQMVSQRWTCSWCRPSRSGSSTGC